jgi:hypothetical protein
MLIECQAYPGNSGSPLFVGFLNKGKYRLYLAGVIAAFYPEQQGIQIDKNTYEVYTHFGISAAVPISKLYEILYGDELMKRRKEKVGASMKAKAPKPASNVVNRENILTKETFEDVLRKATRPLKDGKLEEYKE